MSDWMAEFRAAFPSDTWRENDEELDQYSQDAWPRALKMAQAGEKLYRPQVVFHARFAQQVPELLAWANRHMVPVTVRGGGSEVVGSSLPVQGGILLDVSGLKGIQVLDKQGLFVKVGAGTLGTELEEELSRRGFTLHHSPQSLWCSTAGGWVATRSTGQFSSRWGGIEDLLLALTVAMADGTLVSTPLVPRAATGPDLKSLFIGSEGTLGVIVDVTLKIFPIPEHQQFDTFSFPTLQAGLLGLQAIMQSGLQPFLARLYDANETPFVAHGSGLDFPSGGSLLLLGFEGLCDVVKAEYAAAATLIQQQGGTSLGSGITDGWMERRFDVSALENLLKRPGGLADTIEVAHFWGQIYDLHQALTRNLAPLVRIVMGHFSHAYPQGVSLYMILLGEQADAAAAAAQLGSVWDVAMRTALEHGAAISHHHGVGLARQPYLQEALGPGHAVLEQVKDALDPNGILNPGKMAFHSPERVRGLA
jgi:alkyldihydroxyacetonephosphate synthase